MSQSQKAQKPAKSLTYIFSRSDYWVDALAIANPDATDVDNMGRSNRSAAALYAERKHHYDTQQVNFRSQDLTRQKSRRRDDPVANVTREINYRHSSSNGHTYPSVPAPDYSPQLPRVAGGGFDSRPPLRSALRASRY